MSSESWTTIASIQPLPHDWDGQGAGEITQATADLARRVLPGIVERFGAPTSICPTPPGEIDFSWQDRDGWYRECTIRAGQPLEWWETETEKDSRHWVEDVG